MKHVLKSGAAALAAAALVLTVAGAANAGTAKVDDRKNDVWRFADAADEFRRASSPMNADIDKTVVKHGNRNLVITTRYERLKKADNVYYAAWAIRTGTGETYSANVIAGPGFWRGQHQFFTQTSPAAMRQMPRVGTTDCADMTHDTDYRADKVTVTIPRACLADAEELKVKSFAISFNEKTERTWLDNGHHRGHSQRGWTRMLSAG